MPDLNHIREILHVHGAILCCWHHDRLFTFIISTFHNNPAGRKSTTIFTSGKLELSCLGLPVFLYSAASRIPRHAEGVWTSWMCVICKAHSAGET